MAKNTKLSLSTALLELLESKPLDKITVTELVKKCGVNRQTFYYNFRDIYDLVEWTIMEDVNPFLTGVVQGKDIRRNMIALLNFMKNNRRVIVNIANSISRSTLERYEMEQLHKYIGAIIDNRAKGIPLSPENREFIIRAYSLGIVGLIFDWIHGDMQNDITEFVDKFLSIADGSLPTVIDRMNKTIKN